VKQQKDALFAVQAFHSTKVTVQSKKTVYPTVTSNGKTSKLMEKLILAFVVPEILDGETVIAWADDELNKLSSVGSKTMEKNELEIPGREAALVAAASVINQIKISLEDEVEEADIEDDIHVRQIVK
jgi:hypothetical protein